MNSNTILILTQSVDKNDPILGFFHRWLEELAKSFAQVTVICLQKGEYALPANVKVLSLGKEEGNTKAEFLIRFYRYIWNERGNYNTVFVHMNQEYVLLAGELWRLWGKKIFLWRNHAHGDALTWLSALLSHKVFYTSPSSFTARFKNAVQMPVGIDTDFYKPEDSVARNPHSILFLGRIAPVKRVLEFIEWLHGLKNDGKEFTATIAGAALPENVDYQEEAMEIVSKYGLSEKVQFIGAVSKEEALRLYRSHETYANMTPAGSFDKTILEAAACEMKLFVENQDLKELEKKEGKELRDFVVENHSLKKLMERLSQEL